MFLMPADVRRNFMMPLLADLMGAERLLLRFHYLYLVFCQSISFPCGTTHRLTYLSSRPPQARSPVAGTLFPAATADCACAIQACAPRARPAYRAALCQAVLC